MKIQFLGHTNHIAGAQTHGPVLLSAQPDSSDSFSLALGSDGPWPSHRPYGADGFFQVHEQQLRYSHDCLSWEQVVVKPLVRKYDHTLVMSL